MKYRTLGRTGLKVSVIGMGTWQLGGEWGKDFSQDEVDAMFDQAREAGINFIDTAECYGDHTSESLIGNAILRDREKWIIGTKFGHKYLGPYERTEPRRPQDVAQQLEESLRALRSDYIDLYQYHSWGDDQFFNDEVLAVLQDARRAGKLRHIGNSIGKNTNVKQIEASTRMDIEVVQIRYNRLEREPEQEVFPSCQRQNLGVLARVPLASGLLSGKYRPGAQFPSNDVRHARDRAQLDAQIREVEEIRQNEVPTGTEMAQWALAWCLRHPAVTCVIPGCKNVKQVQDNAAAAQMVNEQSR